MIIRGIKHSIFVVLCSIVLTSNLLQAVPTPQSYFGFKPGADRMLFDYEALIGYLKKIDPV